MTTPIESEADPILAIWAEEVAGRVRDGQPIDLADYERLDPLRAEQLKGLIPAMELMAGLHGPPADDKLLGAGKSGGESFRMLGEFAIIRELGRGGMGVVYEAEQPLIGRRVALKVLPPAAALDPLRLHRFEMEMKVLALLDHRHIVPVYAVGHDGGIPYFAMPLIRGQDLAQIIGELRRRTSMAPAISTKIVASLVDRLIAGRLIAQGEAADNSVEADSTPRARSHLGLGRAYYQTVAQLGVQVAGALAHAHGLGVLHRDIKPANLLLDSVGHLWVTDFGLARLQGDDGPTISSDMLGTLRYMSPEQAKARHGQVDQRSDIYSLGLTFYEMLTLEPAFPIGDDRSSLLRRIAEDEPISPRKLNPSIPRDLETIVRKAMAKNPRDRYPLASDFAEDLGRFLRRESILARPTPAWERVWKWSRRRPLQASFLALAALMVVGLVAGLAILQRQNVTLKREIDRADRFARDADAQRLITRRHLYDAQIHLTRQALNVGQIERAQDILEEIKPDEAGVDPRGFAWHYLWRQSRSSLLQIRIHECESHYMTLSADGRYLISLGRTGDYHVWDLEAERLVSKLVFESISPVTGVAEAFLFKDPADNRTLARLAPRAGAAYVFNQLQSPGTLSLRTRESNGSYSLEYWDIVSDQTKPRLATRLEGLRNIKSTDGSDQLLIDDGTNLSLSMPGNALLRLTPAERYRGGSPQDIRPDGQLQLRRHSDHGVFLVEVGSEREVARLDVRGITPYVLYSPDGRTLALTDDLGFVHLWDWQTGNHRSFHPDGSGRRWLMAVAFSPDGGKLCGWCLDPSGGGGPVFLWDIKSGKSLARFPGRPGLYNRSLFARDGRSVFLSEGRTIRRWFFEREPLGSPDSLMGHGDEAWAVAFSPDGRLLATGSDDTDEPLTIKLWDTTTGNLVRGWRAGLGTVACLAMSPDGRTIASGHLTGTNNVRLWDLATGAPRATFSGHTDKVRAIAFSPDGSHIASAGSDTLVRIWDLRTGAESHVFSGHGDTVRALAFRGDGRLLASSGNDSVTRLWDPVAGTEAGRLSEPQRVGSVAFIPGGSRMATVGESGIISIREASEKASPIQLLGEDGELRILTISPDGRTLAAAGKSGKIHLWDILTGQELLILEGHGSQINGLAFSPDGRTLASCSHDGAVKLWRTQEPAR